MTITRKNKAATNSDSNGAQVSFKGTLWLIERMVDEAVISVDHAAEAYERMRAANRRLPWPDDTKQLKRLGHKSNKVMN